MTDLTFIEFIVELFKKLVSYICVIIFVLYKLVINQLAWRFVDARYFKCCQTYSGICLLACRELRLSL